MKSTKKPIAEPKECSSKILIKPEVLVAKWTPFHERSQLIKIIYNLILIKKLFISKYIIKIYFYLQ